MKHFTDEQLKLLSAIVEDSYNAFVSSDASGVTFVRNLANTNDNGVDKLTAALHTDEDLCNDANFIKNIVGQISEAIKSIAIHCFVDESVEYISIYTGEGKVCGKDGRDLTTPELKPLIQKCSAEYYMKDREKAFVFDAIVSGWYTTVSSCLIRSAVLDVFDKDLQEHYPDSSVTGVIYGFVVERS